MRRIAKALIHPKLRFFMRIFWIGFTDLITSSRFKFAKNSPKELERAQAWPERITIGQPINVSSHSHLQISESPLLSKSDLFFLALCGESDKKSRI